MVDHKPELSRHNTSAFRSRTIFIREWPYIAMLMLALVGVTYTSISRQAMTTYWMILVPFFGIICLFVGWRDIEDRKLHWRLIQTEMLHWSAVMFAMNLVFVADLEKAMSAEASALVVLTLLALGTFLAGIHIASWRISFVGIVLALGVPIVAWLEERTLLIMLGAMILVVFAVLVFLHDPGDNRKDTKWTSA